MLYITGDTHGDWITRLKTDSFPEQKEMTKDDYVLILGDFGIWSDSSRENYNLDWLNSKSFTTLFIDGNHENFNRLYDFPVKEWHGGKVHEVRPSVLHLMRGQVFDIEDKKFFSFGGASSHDIRDGILDAVKDKDKIKRWSSDYSKLFRIRDVSWWERELPTKEEMNEGLDNLAKHDNKVDYIVTHSAYNALLSQLDGGNGLYESDYLTDYLQNIKQTVDYKQWCFGHFHINETFHWERATCLYEQIVRAL